MISETITNASLGYGRPEHKGFCALHVKSDPDIGKLCQILMANLLLRRHIEVLIIHKLELLQKPDTDQPFRAQIIIGFEPASVVDFFSLFVPSAVIDANPLEGMLQIHQILPEHFDFGGISKNAVFPQSELEKRRINSCLSGLGALPFGFIQFIHGSDEKVTMSCMDLLIQEASMDLARKADDLEIPVDFEGRTTLITKPPSEWSRIEFVYLLYIQDFHGEANSFCSRLVNALIRQDSENQWLLRIKMKQKQKQMIKNASVAFYNDITDAVPTPTDARRDVFAVAMGAKVIQESVYPIYLERFPAPIIYPTSTP